MDEQNNGWIFHDTIRTVQFEKNVLIIFLSVTKLFQEFYICPLEFCSKTVSKIEDDFNLKLHLSKYHSLQLSEIFPCELCPLKALSEEDLRAHQEEEHPSARAQCYLCHKAILHYHC